MKSIVSAIVLSAVTFSALAVTVLEPTQEIILNTVQHCEVVVLSEKPSSQLYSLSEVDVSYVTKISKKNNQNAVDRVLESFEKKENINLQAGNGICNVEVYYHDK